MSDRDTMIDHNVASSDIASALPSVSDELRILRNAVSAFDFCVSGIDLALSIPTANADGIVSLPVAHRYSS